MPDKKAQRLATALGFANLGLDANAQAQRADAARVAQAIQMMGLQQQQEAEAARQAHAMEMLQLNRDELGFRQQEATANRNMSNWQATDTSQRAWENLQREKDAANMSNWQATDASQRGWDANTRVADAQNKQNQLALLHEVNNMTAGGLPPSPLALSLLRQYEPSLGAAYDQQQGQDQAAKMARLGLNPDGTFKTAGGGAPVNAGTSAQSGAPGPRIAPDSVTGAVVAQPTGSYNPSVDPLQMLQLLRQNDPATAKAFDALNGVHAPWGQGTAFEGSPLYLKQLRDYEEAKRRKAEMLAPYLFKLYGTDPINLNQA